MKCFPVIFIVSIHFIHIEVLLLSPEASQRWYGLPFASIFFYFSFRFVVDHVYFMIWSKLKQRARFIRIIHHSKNRNLRPNNQTNKQQFGSRVTDTSWVNKSSASWKTEHIRIEDRKDTDWKGNWPKRQYNKFAQNSSFFFSFAVISQLQLTDPVTLWCTLVIINNFISYNNIQYKCTTNRMKSMIMGMGIKPQLL